MPYQEKPALDELMHYGVKRRSGRYPWGSGKDPYQHSEDFLARIEELRKSGFDFTDEDGKKWTGDNAIAKSMGLTINQFRTQYALAKDERRSLQVARAKSLREDGLSLNQIAKEMGFENDSSVRSLLNQKSEARMNQAKGIANDLKKLVDEKGMLDVGAGVERELNVSKEKLDQALYILELEGYNTFGGRVPQVTNPKQQTTIKVLCPPDTPYKVNADGKKVSAAIYDFENIHSVRDYISRDGGVTLEKKFNYPESMDSKRLMIRYKEDGGIDKDGLVELRPGVKDLSLGGSHYSQVRILVDNSKYIKGMAIYGNEKDFPPGVDIIFNTNKTKDVAKLDVLKDIKKDPDNPFGSAIKDAEQGGQYWYNPKTGERVSANTKGAKLGLINKRSDEGDWSDWKDKLPSQFLSKQSTTLAKKQLGIAAKDKQDEFNAIMALENPTVKKKLLQDFSDGCDSAAVHLYAAALPRQKYQVIIPLPSLKDNEIYAPNYNDGEQLALIRYPHGGTFEIPIVTVNNKHKVAKTVLDKNAKDAVCINSKVAERLSGADFDGDTVMVIPTNAKVKIKSRKQLEGLKDFDPKVEYGTYEKNGERYNADGVKIKVMKDTQNQMGRISNLITDMTIRGAEDGELARAVRHSMVVIDAEKHKLDYKKSYADNGIEELKKKYQEGGASTLLSRAKSETSVDKRQGSPRINTKLKSNGDPNPDYDPSRPEGALTYKTADDLYYPVRKFNKKTGRMEISTSDGKKVSYDPSDKDAVSRYEPVMKTDPNTGKVSFTNKNGDTTYKYKKRTEPSTKMEDTDDARTLISKANSPMELVYADYANKMKALANQARKEMVMAGKIEYDSRAKTAYQKEVDSLKSKLNEAAKSKPRERQAQTIANSVISAKVKANPDMKKDEVKKLKQRELSKAREMVGAKRIAIDISEREWEAIQAGAVSETTLKNILNYADMDKVRELATPRITKTVTPAKVNRIKSMKAAGLTNAQIANALGLSASTVSKYLN